MYRKRMVVLSLSLFAPLLLGLLLIAGVIASRSAHAAPVAGPIVYTLDDEDDGSCAYGDCSLREAIVAATAGDTITFVDKLAGTIFLLEALGDLDIDKDLTIDGGGVITVSGNNKVRVFNVKVGNVTLDSLTIADGSVQTLDCGVSIGYKCGGGIILQNSSVIVTLTNSTLSGNSAENDGSGIYNESGILTVTNSTLSGNSAGWLGGGIYNGGTVTVINSTLSGNSAEYDGGGIYNFGTVTVTNSFLSGNSAVAYGGGIFNNGIVTVTNSTLSGNSAGYGGGIFNTGTVTVTNSTLSGNSADYGGGIYNIDGTVTVNNSTLTDNRAGTSGGGISSYGSGVTFTTIGNTIVSGNIISGTTTADDLALYAGSTNSFSSNGYNLIGTKGTGIIIAGTGDRTGVNDPQLDPLASNGGNTSTHALLPESLAIDNGECSSGPAADQRGVTRPQDDSCDIGAYEGSCVMTMKVMNNQSSGSSSLREAIAGACFGSLITFDDELAGKTIDISPDGELLIDKSVTISGNVPITVSGDNKVRVFNVKAGNVTFDSLTIADGSVQTFDCGELIQKCGGGIILQKISVIVRLTNSTLSGNSAKFGGGIFNFGTLTVINSTLSGNSAEHDGGGIFSERTMTVTNSTLSGNSAGYGGGIINNKGTATFNNSTLTKNHAGTSGGGITSRSDIDTFTNISNTIVSGNIKSGTTTADDLALYPGSTNNFSSGGYNLIGAIGLNIIFDGPADQISIYDPELDPLADNGGESMTHALLPGSPALDAGGNCGVATDQRGLARPQGIACDTGAFEVQFPTLTVLLAGTGSGSVTSLPSGINCFDGAGSECTESYWEGTAVTLTATATAGSSFSGWNGGGCSDSGNCVVSMTEAKNVSATFTLNQYKLSVTLDGTGSGTVSSNPVGISCGSDCSESYGAGTVVTLTAAAGAGSEFTGWSGGGCSGAAACVVTMDGDKEVTACFTATDYNVFLPVVIR